MATKVIDKQKIKFLAGCLILLFLFFVPQKVEAANYSGSCGKNLTWNFDSNTDVLTISGTGAMYDYVGVEGALDGISRAPWTEYVNHAGTSVKVIIEEGVTSVGTFAFEADYGITSVSLPTTITTIKTGAFRFCKGLYQINFPSSLKTIQSKAFYNCTRLTNITFPDSITSMGTYSFGFCTSLTNVKLSAAQKILNTGTFYYCTSLNTLQFPPKMTSIRANALYGCNALKSLTWPSCLSYIGTNGFPVNISNGESDVQFQVFEESKGYRYAVQRGIEYTLLDRSIEDLQVVDVTTNSLTLTWTEPENGATSFGIYKYDDINDKYIYIAETTNNSYTFKNLIPGTELCYVVKSCIDVGQFKYDCEYSNVVWTGTIPAKVELKSLTANRPEEMKLTWKITGKEAGFSIWICEDELFESEIRKISYNSTVSRSKIVKNLLAETTYYVKIRSYSYIDGKKVYSEWSNILSVTATAPKEEEATN